MLHPFRYALLGASLLIFLLACNPDRAPKASLTRVKAHLPKEPRRLFPLAAASAYETQVNDLIYQYLVHFDPLSEQLAPQLAEELPSVQTFVDGTYAGLTGYTFTLREGATWSDGMPVTVEDVIFTFKAIWYPGFAGSPLQAGIRELVDIERDASNSRRFTVIASTRNLNAGAYYGNIPILPAHVYDPQQQLQQVSLPQLIATPLIDSLPTELQSFWNEEQSAPFGKTTVVGSGPYQLDVWEPEQLIRLVRSPNFWAAELEGGLFLAHPDTIEFLPVPDQTAALAMLRNGDLDVLANVPPQEAVALREQEPELDIYTPLQLTQTFIYLNTTDPKLADKRTRRGLAHLLDVDGFLQDVQLGFGKALHSPYHPSQDYAKRSEHPVELSLDSARANFERAGWTDSDDDGIYDKLIDGELVPLELEYLYPSISSSSEALALLYAADAAKAGVKIVPIGKEYGALLGDLSQRNFQLVQGALGGEPLPDDPYALWHTESNSPSGKNRAAFGNAMSDSLINEIRINLDASSRKDQYEQLAEIIAEEQPVIFLIVPQERIAVRAGLKPLITARRPGYWLPGFTARKSH